MPQPEVILRACA